MSCIFCKIVSGEIPAYKVFENDKVLAFLDITQGTKGHTLLVPKQHVKNVYELPEELARDIFSIVPTLATALKQAFNPIGLNIVQNNDKPHQTVDHFHLHLLPRYDDDGMRISTENNYELYQKIGYDSVQTSILEALKK